MAEDGGDKDIKFHQNVIGQPVFNIPIDQVLIILAYFWIVK